MSSKEQEVKLGRAEGKVDRINHLVDSFFHHRSARCRELPSAAFRRHHPEPYLN